jgi:hypothetical protein
MADKKISSEEVYDILSSFAWQIGKNQTCERADPHQIIPDSICPQ